MASLDDILLTRLTEKGIIPVEVPGFIKDILNIIGPGGDFTVPMINDRLKFLIWEEKVIDGYTFELILCFLEELDAYEVVRNIMH